MTVLAAGATERCQVVPDTAPVPPGHRRSLLPLLLPVLAVSLLALASVTYRLPYYAVAPGPSLPVDDLIEVPPGRSLPHTGQFLITSVSLRDVTPFEALRDRLDPDVAVLRMKRVIGVNPTPRARRQFDADIHDGMEISQRVAVFVAFRRLGRPLAYAGSVRIDAGRVGGASGGLALTLGLLDALSVGNLTGGHRVAVTGTIAPDGKVGEVDGVAQKAAAARVAHADYLLVPPGAYDEAVAHAGRRLRVLQVTSLDDALDSLAGVGGALGVGRPQL